MIWSELTSAELDAVDRSTPVILSVAATEQHGPHLALATDAVIGRRFLDAIEAEFGPGILVLPQIQIGCSEHHMDFPGTLSVGHDGFLAYVGDIMRSVLRHGFRNVIVLNSHGGNQAVGQVLIEKLGAEYPDRTLALLTWWRLAGPDLEGIRQSASGGLGHACEFETSLMLRAAPNLVRRDLTPTHEAVRDPAPVWAREDMLDGSRGLLHRTMRTKSGGDGVVGAPQFASAEKGRQIEDAVAASLFEVVRSLATEDARLP